jgi:hypothetical protein
MKNQNRPVVGDKTLASGLEMPCQNRFFADLAVREKTIGSLGVRPILANPWDASTYAVRELL